MLVPVGQVHESRVEFPVTAPEFARDVLVLAPVLFAPVLLPVVPVAVELLPVELVFVG